MSGSFNEYQVRGRRRAVARLGVTMFAGLTMVSNVKFYSGKDINLRRAVPFSVAVLWCSRCC